ncbi:MAG: PAS domain S-box protein [Nanoarchaeota archaeon]
MVSKGKIYFNQKNLLEHYLESITDGISVTDLNGITLDVNTSAVKMFGYENKKDIVGKPFFKAIPKKDLKKVKKKFKDYISNKEKKLENYEMTLNRKNGEEFPALLNINSIYEGDTLVGNISVIRDISNLKKLEGDKAKLKEKLRILTDDVGLTKYEKLVLYGLVKYPLKNDRELSKELSLKRSTVTAIRNKLFKAGFYTTYIAPNFYILGCTSVCILAGKFPENGDVDGTKLIKKITLFPEVVRAVQTETNFILVVVSEKFGDTKEIIDLVSSLYSKKNENMLKMIHFPFKKSTILWDHCNAIRDFFKLPFEREKYKENKLPPKVNLNKNEKLVLYALARYPNSTDTEIAKKLKLSRPTVTKLKKNMINGNALRVINTPNYGKLNFGLLVYSYAKKKTTDIKELETPGCIFCINRGKEISKILVFKNFLTYQSEKNKFKQILSKNNITNSDTKNYVYQFNQIIGGKLDFSDLIKKNFNLDVDI